MLNLLDVVTLSVVTVSYNGSVSLGTWSSLSGTVQYEYSLDNGVSWTPFYTYSQTLSNWSPTVSSEIPVTVTAAISGLTNLDTVYLRFVATITGTNNGSFSPVYITGQINAITATIDNNAASDPFDGVQDGMLAVLGTTDPTPVTIASVASATLIGGVYTQLLVTTQTAHGLAANSLCSVYGTNNDLVDGFYVCTVGPNSYDLSRQFLLRGLSLGDGRIQLRRAACSVNMRGRQPSRNSVPKSVLRVGIL